MFILSCFLTNDALRAFVAQCLAEDLGAGDITAELIPPNSQASGYIVTREDCVVCGIPIVNEVFAQLSPNVQISWAVTEGDKASQGQQLCTLVGPARALVSGERTALNFLQTLSGTATITRKWVEALLPYHTKLLDTRKTIPGLRLLQKYAVRVGDGQNHRFGLFDAFLIKENHLAVCASIQAAVGKARQLAPERPLEVEVETLEQLQVALDAGVTQILLDNFDLEAMKKAVILTQHRATLEASGNITLDNVNTVASTGVDFISVGALTKHICAIDLSMRISTMGPYA